MITSDRRRARLKTKIKHKSHHRTAAAAAEEKTSLIDLSRDYTGVPVVKIDLFFFHYRHEMIFTYHRQ